MGASSPSPLDARYEQIEPTISRESSYWWTKFPKGGSVGSRSDLYQEGWLVAAKVLTSFDDTRGVDLKTYLTRCLRNRFSDMLQNVFRDYLRRTLPSIDNNAPPRAALEGLMLPEAEGLAAIGTLDNDERVMVGMLLDCDGSARAVRRKYGFSVTEVNKARRGIAEKLR